MPPASPCNMASAELTRMLLQVEPSTDGQLDFHPCRAQLRSGAILERLLCVRDRRGFRSSTWIHPDEIVSIEESPWRLPVKFANTLYAAGESGMGYLLWTARLRSGRELVFVGSTFDFPDFPEGVVPGDVVAVVPHLGRERASVGAHLGSAPHATCFFVPHGAG